MIAIISMVVPIVMYRKSDDSNRKLFIKKLLIMSLVLFILAMINLYIADIINRGHGWAILIVWIWNAAWILSLIATIILAVFVIIVYKIIIPSKKNISEMALLIVSNFIFPFYLVVLIFWSFIIIKEAILDVVWMFS